MIWLLVAAAAVVLLAIRNSALKAELSRTQQALRATFVCRRCGEKGSAEPRPQLQSVDSTGKPPVLCSQCFDAVEEFGRVRMMLETERRMRFGRYQSIAEAEKQIGADAIPSLALFHIAKQSMDKARRACTSDGAFERYKPSLDAALADQA